MTTRASPEEAPGCNGFVELAVRTNYSFLRGGSSPEATIARAAELGYDALAITDCDGLYGIVRAHEEAEKQGVRLIVGCELTIDGDDGKPVGSVFVHVADHDGYRSLCRILTRSHERHPKGKPKGKGGPKREGERSPHSPRNLYA